MPARACTGRGALGAYFAMEAQLARLASLGLVDATEHRDRNLNVLLQYNPSLEGHCCNCAGMDWSGWERPRCQVDCRWHVGQFPNIARG